MLQSFLTVGQQIVTLYLLMVVGFVLGKVKLLDDRGSVALSSLVMYVVSPCMMVVAFQRPLERETLRAFGTAALVALLLHALFIAASYLLVRDGVPARQRALRFATVFSNSGFMGWSCMASSSSMGLRLALYAASALWRNVGSRRSKVTHRASGFSSSTSRCMVVRKPKMALVCSPCRVVRGRTPW